MANVPIKFPEEPIHLAPLIQRYTAMGHVHVDPKNDNTNPITEIAKMDVRLNDNRVINIPVFVRATIRRSHLKKSSPRQFEEDVMQQLIDMNFINEIDERGHLLAHSLGGTETVLNIVPMASGVNRHHTLGDSEKKQDLKDLSFYLSNWRAIEDRLFRFLEKNPGGQVEWIVALIYNDNVSQLNYHGPARNLRPIYFTMKFTCLDANMMPNDRSGQILYINSNDYYVPWVEYGDA